MHNVLPAAADAGFYELVHELIEAERLRSGDSSSPKSKKRNHRSSDRRPFECLQLLAPFCDGRLPSQAEFRPVLCRDLSSGGFSFLVEKRVDFEQVIVALGPVPFKFFTAAVVNQTSIRKHQRQMIRVGCRFSGRVE
jgi:hypothetical protein